MHEGGPVGRLRASASFGADKFMTFRQFLLRVRDVVGLSDDECVEWLVDVINRASDLLATAHEVIE